MVDSAQLSVLVEARRRSLETQRRSVTISWEHRRRTIERALHDGLQQQLLALRIDLLRATRLQSPDVIESFAAEAKLRIESTAMELHRLASGGRSSVLDVGDLGGALRELASQAGIAVNVAAPPQVRADGPTGEVLVFVASEALANTQRYAPGAAASIELQNDGTSFVLVVCDNGTGGGARIVKGRGLHGLQRRVEALGGSLAVTSTAHGTTIRVVVPVGPTELATRVYTSNSLASTVRNTPKEALHTEEATEDALALNHTVSNDGLQRNVRKLRSELQRVTSQVDLFEASLHARLTSVPRTELALASAALHGVPAFTTAAAHVERANERLRELVSQLRLAETVHAPSDIDPSDIGDVLRSSLEASALRHDVNLTLHAADMHSAYMHTASSLMAARTVERIVEEFLLDSDEGSTMTVNVRIRRERLLISVQLERLPSPLTVAFVDELVYAANGAWSFNTDNADVTAKLDLPCAS